MPDPIQNPPQNLPENPTVAIMMPGDMGHAVAAMLRGHGLRVITCLEARSPRTRALAAKAGMETVADDDTLVQQADLLLSILVPSSALELARRIAAALERTGTQLLYVDCNAIAPATARQVGLTVEAAGARFVDAGIIGPPPRAGSRTPSTRRARTPRALPCCATSAWTCAWSASGRATLQRSRCATRR